MIHKRFYWKKTIIIISLVSCIFLLNFTGGERIKEGFFWISSPLLNISNASGKYLAQQFHSIFSNKKNLEQENQNLRQQISQFLALQGTNQQLVEENILLRKSLSLKEKEGIDTLSVQVIAQNLSQDWILINKGAKEGILVNQPVITFEKALVGKIIAVYSHTSQVQLISHSESTVQAEILQNQEPSIQGLIQGKGSGHLDLELVPLENQLEPDEILITSNLNTDYPAGFLIGKIQTIKKENTQPFQKAEIIPFFQQQGIHNLLIITWF